MQELASWRGHDAFVESIAFSPDGELLASADSKGGIRLWDASSGKQIYTIQAHKARTTQLCFSSNGNVLVSGSIDGTCRLWDVTNGREVTMFLGHVGMVTSVVFTPDDQYVLSGATDGTVRLWDVQTKQLVLTRIPLKTRDWLVIAPDGAFDGTSDGLKMLHYTMGVQTISFDALFDQFFQPRLTVQVLEGHGSRAMFGDVKQKLDVPPRVHILNLLSDKVYQPETVEVVVHVEDLGGGIGEIRLYHNGKRVSTGSRGLRSTRKTGRQHEEKFSVFLLPGRNELRATAFSRNRIEGHPYVLEVHAEKRIVEATLYLLAIGISDYKNPAYRLKFARDDAEAVVEALQLHGRDLFKQTKVFTLYDRAATRSALVAHFGQIQSQAQPEDVFILYYAGHGAMGGETSEDRDFYLGLADVTQLYGQDEQLKKRGVGARELRDFCVDIGARKQVAIFDACHSGGAVTGFSTRGAAREKAIQQLARSTGTIVLAASQEQQYATEIDALNHGLFSSVLLSALQGDADGSPHDGKVTIREIAAFLEDRVPSLSLRYLGTPQYPNVFSRGQDFPICIPSVD